MGTRIAIEKPKRKATYPYYVAGVGLLLVGVIIIWIFQFRASIRNGVFADFATEFQQTGDQVQAGVDLIDSFTVIPEDPTELFGETFSSSELDERTQDLLNEQKGQLPISE